MSCACVTDCRCCSGISTETPAEITNRAGLSAIAYRIGTHGQFRETLLARISASGWKPLRGLRTRDDSDYTIALLDAFSTMADVLTFYQERIAIESYLRTAVERRSLIELARLIGYELRPGVAASAYLAFTIDDAPGAFGRALTIGTTAATAPEQPPPVAIPSRTAVQSIPAPGEAPQIFETVEDIEARVEWNAMRPRLTLAQTLTATTNTLWISGVDHNVKAGDSLLLVPTSDEATLRVAHLVTLDAAANLTLIELIPRSATGTSIASAASAPGPEERIATAGMADTPRVQGHVEAFRHMGELNDSLLASIFTYDWNEESLDALARVNRWYRADLQYRAPDRGTRRPLPPPRVDLPEGPVGVFVMRKHAAVFGHNAPNWGTLPMIARYAQPIPGGGNTTPPYPTSWEDRTLEQDAAHPRTDLEGTRKIDLDRVYEEVTAGWIVLQQADTATLPIPVGSTEEITRADFTLSGRTTRVHIKSMSLESYKMRNTVVLLQSDPLSLADIPDASVVHAEPIILDAAYTGLRKGQTVILTGERHDQAGKIESETRALKEITTTNDGRATRTAITLSSGLEFSYKRPTVTINGNVAFATHGQTVDEIAGSGDATQPFQTFTLRQPPLTYVPAETETGGATTLEVRVNEVLWSEVPSFFGHAPGERIYITRLGDDGNTTVMFGDGITGTRLPTGTNNVKFRYRRGIGVGGAVKQSQISQVLRPITGVKGVTNPNDAEGAADPDSIDDLRSNATLTAYTLGRVVSLRDYEDYARAYLGIAKAHARWAWSGEERAILVTVAGPGGAVIGSNDDLAQRLRTSMRTLGDPGVPISILPAEERTFALAANVRVDPALEKETALNAVKQTAIDRFSFDARAFGQPVSLSEIYAVLSSVRGVLAAEVKSFYATDDSTATPLTVRMRIAADPASATSPARLLTVSLAAVQIGEMLQ